MLDMFGEATSFDQRLQSLLIGWVALDLESDVHFNGGNSVVGMGTVGKSLKATTARENMEASKRWMIMDGGPEQTQ